LHWLAGKVGFVLDMDRVAAIFPAFELQTVTAVHARLTVAVGAVDSYWLELHSVTVAHARSAVVVGGVVS